MPLTTAKITGEQRDALFEFVVEHLSRLPDLPLAIDQEDFATARRLAQEFSEDFRLLDDLGWGKDARLEVALTMPPGELAETFRRLRAYAQGALTGSQVERESREAAERFRRRDQVVLDVGTELLIELQVRGGELA